ncbi:MAG: flagellin [Armatimonadetes bacterium]|nr:flagellin [Armatimonadota bacterium]
MSLRINLNSAALIGHRSLATNDDMLSRSIERLSTGYKINRASDGPAGLAISESLRAQIGGLKQAISNTQDAVNMVKTAEGALAEVHSLLRSMRDLAVHALNTGAVDDTQLAADQSQITSAIDALNRISSNTAFGGKKLLDGTAGVAGQVTTNPSNGAFISGGTATKAGTYTVTINTAATKATYAGTGGAYAAQTGTVTINNVAIALNSAVETTAALAVQKINLYSEQTGVTASVGANGVELTQNSYGAGSSISLSFGGSVTATTLMGTGSTLTAGVNANITVTGGTVNATNVNGSGRLVSGAAFAGTDLDGAVISANGLAASTFDIVVTQGSLQFQVGSEVGQTASVALNSTHSSKLGIAASGLETSATSVADIDVTTLAGARDALRLIDASINQVSTVRSDLGAAQKNVFESAINSLTVASENIAASESAIRDTDMAAEMAEFSKSQILMQSSVAMLVQANSAPQQLVQLLRG